MGCRSAFDISGGLQPNNLNVKKQQHFQHKSVNVCRWV